MAAGATYEPISTQTLSSAQSSVTFSSIPGTYTDLILVVDAKTATTANSDIILRFNSDTGTNYSWTYMYGSGVISASGRNSNENGSRINYFVTPGVTNWGFNSITQIMNYSNSTTYKTHLTRDNSNASDSSYKGTEAIVGLWRSTAAITSITIVPSGQNFASGAILTLYGITAA
jgi:hypothetical protein